MAKRSIRALFAWALIMLSVVLPAHAQDEHLQYFGYYANNGYVSQNYNHTNVTFVGVWTNDTSQGTSVVLNELATDKQYGIKAIVDVAPFLFNVGAGAACPYTNLPTASQTFATFVNQLISNGYLVPNNPAASTVIAFYPADEPDGCGLGDVNGVANPALVNALDAVRNNPNTSNFPIAAIFSANYPSAAHGLLLYDWVGYDNYTLKDANYISSFQTFESYADLSHQKTILVPQAAEGGVLDDTPDTPSVMFSAAQSDQSVILLMPFLWEASGMQGTANIPSLLSAYTAIGQQIKYGLFSQFVSQSVPTTMYAGSTYTVIVQMKNIGPYTWPAGQTIRLGSQGPQDNTTWSLGRVQLASNVGPGQVATFTFNVVAPSTTGSYLFAWQMVDDGVEWFGAGTTPTVISVEPALAPPPTDATAYLATTFTTLDQYVSTCNASDPIPNTNFGACFSAIHRYCANEGYSAGGFPEENSGNNALISCVASSGAGALYVDISSLTALQSQCTMSNLITDVCASAMSGYCQAQGYGAGGFGPMESANTTVIVTCMSNTDGALVATTFTALSAQQPTCTASSWTSSGACISAVNRVCAASGYLTGYGITNHSGNTAIIGCMRANIPNSAGAD
jgi:hypothetical protein